MTTEIATSYSADMAMHLDTQPDAVVSRHDLAWASTCGAINGFAFEMLDVWPHETVLEIGFGAGHLLGWITARAVEGLVVGVDPSQAMVDSARRRFRGHIQAGRVEIYRASASSLPFEEGRFDKACAVNSFQLWNDPEQDLAQVRRVLRPGGLLLLCLCIEDTGHRPIAAPTFTPDDLRLVEQLARRAGFVDVRCREQKARQTVTCVLANR